MDGCLLWGNRVVIPPQGRNKLLVELHEMHPGTSRMKSLARSFVWWPNLDRDIDNSVKECDVCQRSRPTAPVAPLHPWEWPNKPWHRVHADYLGPFKGKMILVLVDSHSKWIEAHTTNSSTATATAEIMRQVFATHGIPRMLVTDNGPCFASSEFADFTKRNNIKHVFSAPYHPSSNGLAERAVRTIKDGLKRLRSGSLETQSSRLLFSYRTTPQSTTGISPSEMLMNRRLNTRLTALVPDLENKVMHRQQMQKQHHDQHATQRVFDVGDTVYARLYVNNTTKWTPGIVESITGPLSFTVRLRDGRVLHRHVDQLRKRYTTNILPDVVEPGSHSDDVVLQPTLKFDLPYPKAHVSESLVPTSQKLDEGNQTQKLPDMQVTQPIVPNLTILPDTGEKTSQSSLRRSSRVRKKPQRLDL